MFEDGQDIDLTHHIAVRLKATGRAAKDTPPGFVSMTAYSPIRQSVGTSLASVVLVYQNDGDAFGPGFVLDEFANFAVTPKADLLIGLLAERHAVCHVAEVAYRNRAGFLLDGHIDNSATNLVLDVPDDALMFSFHPGLGTNEFLVPFRSFLFAT